MRSQTRSCVLAAVFAVVLQASDAGRTPETAGELFETARVWRVHLKFSSAQWAAMEPGGGVQPPRFERVGGPGGWGPADLLLPVFLAGDADHDGRLSVREFRDLGERWFSAWSKNQDGQLTAEQVRAGARATLARDESGPPRGAPPMRATAFERVHADLDFEGRTYPDVSVRYKGNNTFQMARNSIKRSFKIQLNRYVKGRASWRGKPRSTCTTTSPMRAG